MRRTSKPNVKARPTATPKAPPPPMPDFKPLIAQAAKSSTEVDFRLVILQALTQTPHRQVEPYIPLFRFIHEKDPLFFGKLAVWYQHHGSVRDLKQLFVAFLSTSSFSEDYREAGAALLHALPPFEVERVLRIIKGHKDDNGKFIEGIAPSVPRVVRTAIAQYLKEREKNSEQFDSVALVARGTLKTLYSSLRIKPGGYAQRILFDNDPPETSRLYSLKLLARSSDPTEQARIIVENKIPYRVAVSNLSQVTGSVLVALINSMSPQELINNMASLQKKGAMDNPDLKRMIDDKLKKAETANGVSALKTSQAIKYGNLDMGTQDALNKVKDKQVKALGSITKSTALLVDKSGSMESAIEVGVQLAALIAPICKNGLHVYAFDDMAYPISVKNPETAGMTDWEKAFHGIKAAGYTSAGAPVDAMRKRNIRVDQFIIVTDQHDNKAPLFSDAFLTYKQALMCEPNVVIINCKGQGPHTDLIYRQVEKQGAQVDQWTFTGDYYGLPSVIPMLSAGSKLELLQEIMDLELPRRKAEKQPVGARA